MSCAKEITYEPIVGGLDARNARGTGRPVDFELVLNLDGSIEEGYSRSMGWDRYNPDPTRFSNADLHDQMWMSESVVNIPPSVITLDTAVSMAGLVQVDGLEVVVIPQDTYASRWVAAVQIDGLEAVIIGME